MTPEDILKKQFKTTRVRPGYDPKEVDDFLDQIHYYLRSVELNEMPDRERHAVMEQAFSWADSIPAALMEQPSTPPSPSIDTITLLLSAAEDAARKVEDEARGKADDLTYNARVHAESVEKRAADIVAAANAQSDEIIKAARAQVIAETNERVGKADARVKAANAKVREADTALRVIADEREAHIGALRKILKEESTNGSGTQAP